MKRTLHEVDPTDLMLPVAAALACAVEDRDQDEVAKILTGLQVDQLYALAILYAAHVDLDRPISAPLTPQGTLHRAVRRAARAFDTTPQLVMSSSRIRNVGEARAVAMTVGRWAGLTSVQIGAYFSRDHTTVLYAEGRVGADARLREVASRIADDIGRGEVEEGAA